MATLKRKTSDWWSTGEPNFTALSESSNVVYDHQTLCNGRETHKINNTSTMVETTLTRANPRALTYRFGWGVGEANGSSYTVGGIVWNF